MGKLFLVLLEIVAFVVIGYFVVKALWPGKPKSSYESLDALKEKADKNKQERTSLQDEAVSVAKTLEEIKKNTN